MRPTLRSKAGSCIRFRNCLRNVILCGFGVDVPFIIRKQDPEAGCPMEAQSVRHVCLAGISHLRQQARR
jgi:hypothetical protein